MCDTVALPMEGTLGRREVAKGAQTWQPRICPVRLSRPYCPSVQPGMDAAPAAAWLAVPLTAPAKRALARAALLLHLPAETARAL